MNRIIVALSLSFFAWSASAYQEDCERPWPLNLPAQFQTKEDALTVQKSVKVYLDEAETYLTCNEAIQKELPPNDKDTPEKLNILISRYNSTVDEMHAIGDRFNQLVRALKEREEG